MSAIPGLIVSLEGISLNPEKMEAVAWFPLPTQLQSFRVRQFLLGLIRY